MKLLLFIIFISNIVGSYTYLCPIQQQLLRKIISNDNFPKSIQNNAKKVVCFHYIPLALKESIIFTQNVKTPKYLIPDYNQIAVNGLIKGVNKYDWTYKHSNLSEYLRKYIVFELYNNLNKNAPIYDSEVLEWKMSSSPNEQYQTYYNTVKEEILEAADKLSPYEKRIFFLVYERTDLKRTKYSIEEMCQMAGIDNAETFRNTNNEIIRKIQKRMEEQRQ